MAAGSVIVKLEAKDNLTPELKKSLEKIKELEKSAADLSSKIRLLSANKQGYIKGAIESDIAAVQKLQQEIKELESLKATQKGRTAQDTQKEIRKRELEIQKLITEEIEKQKNLLKSKEYEVAVSSKRLWEEYNNRKKGTQIIRKEKAAVDSSNKSRMKEDAIRRSLSTTIVRHIRQVESMIVGYYLLTRAIRSIAGAGVELNKTIQDSTIGIAALIASNTKGANVMERFQIATSMAEATVKKLKKAAIETAATFPQLTEIYQQAIGGALAAGKSMGDSIEEISDRTIKLSQRLSNFASAIGMPMVQVNEEIRSIIEGTIDQNSRIAKMLHMTNEEIKKAKESADGLWKYLNDKLQASDAMQDVETFTRGMARLQDAIDTVRIEATKPIFDDLQKGLYNAAKSLNEQSKEIATSIRNAYFEAKAFFSYIFDTASPFIKTLTQIRNEIARFTNDIIKFIKTISDYFDDVFNITDKVGDRATNKTVQELKRMIEKEKDIIKEIKEGGLLATLKYNPGDLERHIQLLKKYENRLKHLLNVTKETNIEIPKLENTIANTTEGFKAVYEAANAEYDSVKQVNETFSTLAIMFQNMPSVLEMLGDSYIKTVKRVEEGTKTLTAITKKTISEDHIKEVWKSQEDALKLTKEYYEESGQLAKAWLIEEQQIRNKYADFDKATVDKIVANHKKAYFEKMLPSLKKASKEAKTIVEQSIEGMNKSFEDNFFDAIMGKFDNFGDFLKKFFKDTLNSIVTPFARSMSQSLAGSLTKSLVGSTGLPNLSGLVGASTGVDIGSTVNPTDLVKAGFTSLGSNVYQDTSGTKVVLDAAGKITGAYDSSGSAISDLSTVSSLYSLGKFGTTAATAGLGMAIMQPFSHAGLWLVGQGATTAGMGTIGLGSGLAHPMVAGSYSALGGGAAGTGAVAGSALAGGAIGYGAGWLGDKLFNADTYASTGGALGGLLGGGLAAGGLVSGPVGWAILGLGTLLGGLFGKKKVTGTAQGIDVFGTATADNAAGQYWGRTDYKKSSWFSHKSWSEWQYKAFDDLAIKAIEKTIKGFDYALSQMDINKTLKVAGGRFSSIDEFLSNSVTKAFLTEATTGDLDAIYKAWSDYAKSIDKKVYEAFADEINKFISYRRDCKEMMLSKKDPVEALKYKADYLQKDFENLANVFDITGVTMENFADRYDKAIRSNLTPEEIDKWQQLGNALKAASDAQTELALTQAHSVKSAKELADALSKAVKNQEVYIEQLRAITQAQFNSEAQFKEYMLQLDNQLTTQITQAMTDFKTAILNAFTTLKQQAQAFIDGWFSSGYPANTSYNFYAERYNALKKELDSNLSVGNFDAAQQSFTTLQTVANYLKSSALAIGNPELTNNVLGKVLTDMESYRDAFANGEDAMKVIIAGDETGLAENETLAELKNAIDKYNSLIAQQLGVSTGLSLESFWTDRSLMTPGNVKAFAEILKPQTMKELDKWINIMGNIRWGGMDYLSTLSNEDQKKALDLLGKTGAMKQFVSGFTPETLSSISTLPSATQQSFYSAVGSSGEAETLLGTAGDIKDLSNLGSYVSQDFLSTFIPSHLTDASELDTAMTYDPGVLQSFFTSQIPESGDITQNNLSIDYINHALSNIAGNSIGEDVLRNLINDGYTSVSDIMSILKTYNTSEVFNKASEEAEKAINNDIFGDADRNDGTFISIDPGFGAMGLGLSDEGTKNMTNDQKNLFSEFDDDWFEFLDKYTKDMFGMSRSTLSSISYAIRKYPAVIDFITSTLQPAIPQFAEGGLVSRPTIGLIGEAGYPEAVIPMKNGRDIPVNMGNIGKLLEDLIYLTEQQANEIRTMRKEIQDINYKTPAAA